MNNIFVESIVDESLRITGNIDERNKFIETKASNKWRPAGRISYYDDVNDKVIGLEGIKYKGRPQGTPNYTNIVIDLVDSRSDDGTNNGKSYNQGDKVEGYTMWEIETALQGCNTWGKWGDNIIKLYDNETKQYVKELFKSW